MLSGWDCRLWVLLVLRSVFFSSECYSTSSDCTQASPMCGLAAQLLPVREPRNSTSTFVFVSVPIATALGTRARKQSRPASRLRIAHKSNMWMKARTILLYGAGWTASKTPDSLYGTSLCGPIIAASRTRLWLLSGRGCLGPHLSTASGNLDMRHGLWRHRPAWRRLWRFGDARVRRWAR